jgi:ubiquinone biosynthesis protein
MALNFHPVQHLRRYHQVGSTFVRHGFGYALDQLQPAVRRRLGRTPQRVSVPEEDLARHFRLALQELGPTFVKLGQILSTRPDLLPPAYLDELSLLQDEVPPEPWEDTRIVLMQEYGRPPEEVLASIDPHPIAAASLAQVHAATLPDGSQVVVKVQRPGIRRIIDTDLDILAELARGAEYTPLARHYDLPAIVDQFAMTMRNELDYRREGRNADRFRANFAKEPQLYIPRVHWEYSTQRVLVLERIYGVRINDLAGLAAAGLDRRKVALASARVIVKEVFEDGFFHADPHPGNFVVMPGEVLGGMDFGMVGYIDDRLRMDLLRLYVAAVQMDTEGVVDQLVRMGAVDEDVRRRDLSNDIGQLLHKYRGVPLKEIRADAVINDMIPIAFRHQLRLPTDLWLLAKTLQMLEGMGLTLDPDFDFFAVSQPIVKRLMFELFMPNERWAQAMLRSMTEWGEVMVLAPRAASRLLQQAERGELFTVHLKEAEPMLTTADRLVTRLSLSVLMGALTLALAVLIPVFQGNVMARILVVMGFLLSISISIWLGFSILASYRRRR